MGNAWEDDVGWSLLCVCGDGCRWLVNFEGLGVPVEFRIAESAALLVWVAGEVGWVHAIPPVQASVVEAVEGVPP